MQPHSFDTRTLGLEVNIFAKLVVTFVLLAIYKCRYVASTCLVVNKKIFKEYIVWLSEPYH